MPAMKCPFCKHENVSGTRFCAECGFSMHLKICPNPQCGKISNVAVAACEFCGQAFPEMAPAAETTTVEPAGRPAPGSVPEVAATKDKPRTAAWHLIAVAIVAGGLPLLWANRASLPTPKTWQVSTQDATKVEGSAPAPIGKMKPPIVPELIPAPTPAPAPADSAAPSSPASAQAPASGVDQSKPAPQDTADIKNKDPEAPPRTADTSKKVAKTPSPKKKETRPCTEATAALGLCDPKRLGK